ncbi:hypothetical protein GCM10027289_20690 [Tsukamurella serpentis]
MKNKALSFTALAATVAIVAAPVSGAVAATTNPVTPAVVVPGATAAPAEVVKNIAPATGPAAALGAFTVVTDEVIGAAKSATGVVELAAVPQPVTDILNAAGLPVQAVYRVLQTAQGVYTIWYKMLTSVPQAIFKGEFGSVPTLFQKAIGDSLTWITTGAGPKAPAAPKAAAVDAAAAPTAVAPVNPFTAALDVIGIPVASAYAAGQVGLTIYKTFYGLLTSVPQALFKGQFGDAANLVVDAFTSSAKAIIEYPGKQLADATKKITTLITSLTPATVAPTVTATSLTSASENTLLSARTLGADTVSDVTAKPGAEKKSVLDSVDSADSAPVLGKKDEKKDEKKVVTSSVPATVEPSETAKPGAPKTDAPKTDSPEAAPTSGASEAKPGKVDKTETPKTEKAETPKVEKTETAKVEKTETAKAEKADKADKAGTSSSTGSTSGASEE